MANVHMLPFRDKCFDIVYCSHLLEHVENLIKVMHELEGVAK